MTNNNISFFSGVLGTKNITIINNTITIYNTSTSLNLSKTTLGFTINNIVMPFSSIASSITVSTLTNTGYYKDSSTYFYYAAPNAFRSTNIICNDYGIGINTLCTITVNLKGNVNLFGFFGIYLANGFNISTGNYNCQTNGTASINSNCTNYNNNTIIVNNITTTTIASSTNVSFLINLTLPISPGNYNINISSFSPGIVDTSLISLNIISRILSNTQFSISSSNQTTLSQTIYSVSLNLPVSILTTSTMILTLPVLNYGVVFCNNGNVGSSFSSPTLNLSLQNPYPTTLKI